jgi:LuxR family maltose regulon positive regulatory protein
VFARSKFLAPQRGTFVVRSELVERLQRADSLPLSIVVGSPGSGKTSVLAEWYRHVDDGSVTWLRADWSDEDPTRFWRGFIVAVQQVDAAFGIEAADLITLDGRVSPDVLESLLEDDRRLGERVRLVIDDFHLVSLAAAQQLQHVIERGLRHIRVLIGSRTDPAVGLHRLRLQDQLCEIREADLRLTLPEAVALVTGLGLDPSSVDVAALHERTEGWAAGVQMAALSVLGSSDPAEVIRQLTGTTQTIAGYLTAEVVANQSPRMQRFLERTCVADELDAGMVEGLDPDASSSDGSRVTLTEAEAANLLLTRVDAAGTSFRYHQLFAEMLRHRLQARDPELFREQHRRAAEHLLTHDDVPGAVRHYSLASMHEQIGLVLRERVVQVFLDTGTPPAVDVSQVPLADVLRHSPVNAAGYAVGLMLNGHLMPAVDLLAQAETMAISAGAPQLDLVHLAAARVAAHLSSGDAATALASVERMLALAESAGVPEGDDWVSAAVPFGVRAAVWEGDLEFADRLVPQIRRHRDVRLTVVDGGSALALLELERGDLPAALRMATDAHTAAVGLGLQGGGADAAARVVIGMALLEQGWFAQAAAELDGAVAASTLERMPTLVLATIAQARVQRAHGNFDAALRGLELLRAHLQLNAPGPAFTTRLDHAELTVRLSVGEFDGAAAILPRLPTDFRAVLAAAWIALLQGDRAGADRYRARLDGAARSQRRRLDLAIYDLRVTLDQASDGAEAAAHAVIDLAEPTGALFPIAEAGATVLHAVCHAAKRRPRSGFVERLLAMQPLPRPADQAQPRHELDELSNRELIVLRYMVTSMTNQEIADALYLSVNTVKTHIKHVLRKLGASSRTEAATRAHELHYL